MQQFNVPVFDDIISGTSGTWYSPRSLDAFLGTADVFIIQATTTLVGGSTPKIKIVTEHSCDGLVFGVHSVPSALNTVSISDGTTLFGVDLAAPKPFGLVRVAVWLAGTSPRCRVRINVTGRIQ